MIKYNSNTINDWNLGSNNIVKVYKDGIVAYQKIEGTVTPPSFNGKFYATYSDGTSYSAECDGNTDLTTATTKAHSSTFLAMKTAEIGNCVTVIGDSAFWNFGGLNDVIIPNSVTTINYRAFRGCTSLTSVTIPNSVTTIGSNAFFSCTTLSNCSMSNSVTSIGDYAFRYCTQLASIELPHGLISIGSYGFSDISISSVTIPSTVTSIGGRGFGDCLNLTNVTCLSITPPNVGANIFNSPNENLIIYVPSQSVETYKSSSGWSTYSSRIQPIQ